MTAGALIAFVALGASVGLGWYLPVAVVLVPTVVLGLAPFPSARAVIALAAGSSFVFVWAGPHAAIGPFDLYLGEAVLFAVLMATALQMSRDTSAFAQLKDPVSLCVGLLCLGAVLGFVVGLARGTGISYTAAGFRPLFFLGAFITFRYALSRPEWRARTLGSSMLLGASIAVVQALQVIVGPKRMLFAVGSFGDLVATDVVTGFLRVRPPGLYLEYVAVCMSAAYLIWGPQRGRVWATLVFLVTLAGILLSFNRNMLIGLAVGLAVAATFGKKRRRLLVGAIVIAATLAVGSLYVGGASAANPIVARFATLADPAARSVALQDRQYENGLALVSIAKSPLVGIGWGTPYGASAVRSFEGVVAQRNRDYVHNQYLAAWLRMGLVGLLGFIGVIGTTLVAAVRVGRAEPLQSGRWLGPAIITAMTALALSSMVDLVILSPSNVPVFAFVAALGSYLWNESRSPSTEAIQ